MQEIKSAPELTTQALEWLEVLQGDIRASLVDIECIEKNLDQLVDDIHLVSSQQRDQISQVIAAIKGQAGEVGLVQILALTNSIENVLQRIKTKQLVPTKSIIHILLYGSNNLLFMLHNLADQAEKEISKTLELLDIQLALELDS